LEQHVVFVEQPVGTTGCFVPTCCSKKNDMLFQKSRYNVLEQPVRTTGCFWNKRLILVEQPVRTIGFLEQPVRTKCCVEQLSVAPEEYDHLGQKQE